MGVGVRPPRALIAPAVFRRTRNRDRRACRSAVARLGRRAFPATRVAPLAIQLIIATLLLVIIWATVNWIVQAIYELTGISAEAPISSRFFGVITPGMTWVLMR